MLSSAAHPQFHPEEGGKADQLPRRISHLALRLVAAFESRVASRRRTSATNRDVPAVKRRKDVLLATVCHELRTPLASIGHAVRLLGGSSRPAETPQVLALITRQVQRMSNLVDDLLDVSRLANGQMRLECERVDLRDVVHNAIQTIAPQVEARRHQLTVAVPDVPVWLLADPLRLEQVFVNLLGNAAKYTESGGRLWLSVDICDAEAVVSIRDSGVGIAPELLPHVFDLFTQADDAEAKSTSGLGIGLAIVRSLVLLHGGNVTAASPGRGQGSQFTVRLPRLDSAIGSAPARPPVQRVGHDRAA